MLALHQAQAQQQQQQHGVGGHSLPPLAPPGAGIQPIAVATSGPLSPSSMVRVGVGGGGALSPAALSATIQRVASPHSNMMKMMSKLTKSLHAFVKT